jgi:hypothetical protein
MFDIPYSDPKDIYINGYLLKLTCTACPEQYDVYKNGKKVGYLRLRHGGFTAEYPDCGGKLVYSGCPAGDGCFREDEREFYLKEAIKAIGNEDEQTALDMISEKEK